MPRPPLVVAHRGASHDAPENTLAAFRLAWEQGADAIEGDFRLTGDGRLVCIHDADTGRVTGTGRVVAETSLAELRSLDAGRWKNPSFTGERLPTLAEVLATLPPDGRLFMELKTGPEIVPPLAEELTAWRGDPAALVVIAFDAATVAACRRSLPAVETHWLTGFEPDSSGGWSPSPERIAAAVQACGADGVGLQAERRVIDAGFVARLRAAGASSYHVWTVDRPAAARLFRDLGAMAITTNRPAVIRRGLADSGAPAGRPAAAPRFPPA